MILQATHTHLYRGHRGTLAGVEELPDLQTGADCLVAFSDGSVACARLARAGGDWQLDTDAYRTAAGTEIAQKRWLVQLQQDGTEVKFRILNKLQDD